MFISADEIFKRTKAEGQACDFPNAGDVNDQLKFTPDTYQAKWVRFRKKNFLDIVCINNVDLGAGIVFEDCNFSNRVLFENTTAASWNGDLTKYAANIVFDNCSFAGALDFQSNCLFERDILIKDCRLDGGVGFYNINISVQQINIISSTISNKFDFENVKAKMGITIDKCEINIRTRFWQGEWSTLAFINSTFKKSLLLYQCTVKSGIAFNDTSCEGKVTINQIIGNCALTVLGGNFMDTFGVEYPDLKSSRGIGITKFFLISCEFVNGFYANGIRNQPSPAPLIDLIRLNISTKLAGDIRFEDFEVCELSLFGFNSKANFIFNRLRVNQLIIRNFINNSQLVFSDVTASKKRWYDSDIDSFVKSQFILETSNLGNAQCFITDFE